MDLSYQIANAASVLKFYWSRSEYYEEPNDTPDSCLYMCVENYFGKHFVAPKEFLHELKSFAFNGSFLLRYLRRMGGQVLHRVWNYKVPLREEIRWNIFEQGRFSLFYWQK